jgi:hypothetical protein
MGSDSDRQRGIEQFERDIQQETSAKHKLFDK